MPAWHGPGLLPQYHSSPRSHLSDGVQLRDEEKLGSVVVDSYPEELFTLVPISIYFSAQRVEVNLFLINASDVMPCHYAASDAISGDTNRIEIPADCGVSQTP